MNKTLLSLNVQLKIKQQSINIMLLRWFIIQTIKVLARGYTSIELMTMYSYSLAKTCTHIHPSLYTSFCPYAANPMNKSWCTFLRQFNNSMSKMLLFLNQLQWNYILVNSLALFFTPHCYLRTCKKPPQCMAKKPQ